MVTEIGSQSGWHSDDVRTEQSHGVREVLQGCLHSHLDVLLPKMDIAGAVELFFIVAITDAIGGEAISQSDDQNSGCLHQRLLTPDPLQSNCTRVRLVIYNLLSRQLLFLITGASRC